MNPDKADFQELAVSLVWWGGLILVAAGLLKVAFYALGELRPGLYAGIRSETLRRFLTGKGNRLVFGLGGFLTAAAGGLFMLAAKGLAALLDYTRL